MRYTLFGIIGNLPGVENSSAGKTILCDICRIAPLCEIKALCGTYRGVPIYYQVYTTLDGNIRNV